MTSSKAAALTFLREDQVKTISSILSSSAHGLYTPQVDFGRLKAQSLVAATSNGVIHLVLSFVQISGKYGLRYLNPTGGNGAHKSHPDLKVRVRSTLGLFLWYFEVLSANLVEIFNFTA